MRHLMITLLLLSVPAICTAEIYKWVDEKGQTGYADDLGNVPKNYRDKAVVTEKQEQAVEIIESSEPQKGVKKSSDTKVEQGKDLKGKDVDKVNMQDKPLFEGKTPAVWKQELARQKHEVKQLEDQLTGIKERMADGSKISRNEYLALQNTQRDLDVRIGKAKKKLDALKTAAENAGVPEEFR